MTEPAFDDNFRSRYLSDETPWNIGRVQPVFERWADAVEGKVLDVGCGTGELSFFLAERGHVVLGIDAEAAAIEQAEQRKAKLAEATGSVPSAEFLVHSAAELGSLQQHVDTVVDCLLFHCLDDRARVEYASGLRLTLRPGGKLLLLVFSDQEPPGNGPRRISAFDLAKTFARGFRVTELEAVPIEVRPDDQHLFSDYGPKGWFAVIERLDDGVITA